VLQKRVRVRVRVGLIIMIDRGRSNLTGGPKDAKLKVQTFLGDIMSITHFGQAMT
jgi:hypothetical protein